ncbi:HD domain-containing protein [Aureispira sp. CCB-E]|uniref:HD domain-containing protein n=1 Tax=Aureispira sp. CCB-E TaxID=3051121 RepID=UPI002868B58F|nr:HD domain-containing protein [Aureispira sp. CCB-E]WMX17188.1 HD domain-containing protein [Aureispira sp. CCB-E]
MEIGSYRWAKTTDSKLSKSEKRQILQQLIRVQFREFILLLQTKTGFNKNRLAQVNLDSIRIPDSKFADLSNELAKETYDVPLYKHCVRTYFFASMLAQYEGYKIDEELLYISAILHDLGISETHKQKACSCCFAVVGAELAYDFASQIGVEEQRAQQIYNAISIHLNPLVSNNQTPEAVVLSRGAFLDVSGFSHRCIPKRELVKLNTTYSRTNFSDALIDTVDNINHLKGTRAEFLRKFGFSNLVRKNPLNKIV